MKPGKHAFVLQAIAPFDARRGYKRFKLPGIGVSSAGSPRANADLWLHPSDGLVVRLSSQGYAYFFAVSGTVRQPLPDEQIEELSDYLAELLLLWLVEGVDDSPPIEIMRRRRSSAGKTST